MILVKGKKSNVVVEVNPSTVSQNEGFESIELTQMVRLLLLQIAPGQSASSAAILSI